MSDSFPPDDYELTDEDRAEAEQLAARFRENAVIAQQIRAEAMNQLKFAAVADPEGADRYAALFEEIRQEALDVERSADRALGIRGRVRAWLGAHRHWSPRGPLQRLSRLVRRVVSSLPRL